MLLASVQVLKIPLQMKSDYTFMLVRMTASHYAFKSLEECDSFQWYEVLITILKKKKCPSKSTWDIA